MSIDSTLTRRMTSARALRPKRQFVSAILPWVVAGAALLVYLLTLNHWVSLGSLERTARVSGWLWQPEVMEPLYWLVTYPLHWLPVKFIPLALNLFSAVCATLTLALLARSVALLPHDRTEEQRKRERNAFGVLTIRSAWVPPVIAALVCGLQLSFWEHATVASGEMLNLLVFAYIIRSLLEFRVDGRDAWLFRSSLLYGAAMANNWAMIGFFPVFLVALVWLRGVSFFNTRFLLRMFLLGVAGLLLYLLLPFATLISGSKDMNFWQALKSNLGTQGLLVRQFLRPGVLFRGDQPFWVLALPSLVPVLALSLRWPAYFGDPSRLGVALTTFILHFMHGVLLVLCLWVALDPTKFGPRHLFGWSPMLTLYYLGALSIGYFCGYFLLVFGTEPVGRPRMTSGLIPLRNQVVVGVVSIILGTTAILLLVRNPPQIHVTNGPMLRLYADSLVERLPRSGAVTLSDPEGRARMRLVEADLARQSRKGDYQILDTDWLYAPAYHRFLKRAYGGRWPFAFTSTNQPARLVDKDVWTMVLLLSKTNQVYYLHPSFGYFFESFYLEPHGLVYKMDQYPTNDLLAPKPDKRTIEENEDFWVRTGETTLKPLLAVSAAVTAHEGWLEKFEHRLHLTREPNPTALALSSFYSLALNHWGVQLQRNGRITEAGARFQRALDLKPENVAAQVNLECNRNLQADKPAQIQLSKAVTDRLGNTKYRGRWEGDTLGAVMNDCGPFDELVFCYRLGMDFAFPPFSDVQPQYHQGALNFKRAAEFAPNDLEPQLKLAQVYLFANMPDQGLRILDDIQKHAVDLGLDQTNADGVVLNTNKPVLLGTTMAAYLSKGELTNAAVCAQTALQKYPRNFYLLSAASRAYFSYGYFSNALDSINEQLQVRPDEPNALYGKGQAQLGLTQYESAIQTFSKVMELETNSQSELRVNANLYRAEAYVADGKLDLAQADYEALLKQLPMLHPLYRALGEVFYQKKDTNAAIRNYQLYKASLTNAEELKIVNQRLKELKPGAH
jgi:tetratricopeptide (TPR) repeat protein